MAGVRGVKSKDGPDLIVWGSSTLTSVLLDQGLVDEVVLIIYREESEGGQAKSLRELLGIWRSASHGSYAS